MAVGAVTAGIIAKFEAERAERNFAAAKSTVDGLIFNIAQGLRNVEGIRVESLDKILDQARKTVERLTENDPGNPALLRSKAVMLDEFAKTYLAAGNLAAAEKNAEESHAILSRLAETEASDKDAIRNLSVSLIRLGDVKRAQGDRKAALAPTRRRSPSTASAPRPTRTNAQSAAGRDSRSRPDRRYQARGRRFGRGTRRLRGGLAIRRELAKADPNDEDWQRAIAVSLGKISDVKRDAGDAAGALAAAEEELAIARRLLAPDPGNTEWQRDVAIALERLGGLKLSAGDVAGALAAYEEGLAIRRRLPRSMRATRSGSATLPSVSARSAT